MMMGNWRDLAALVLLAQLMTLSEGINIEEIGAFEKILSKNVSIVLIDDKADGLLETAIRNVTSLDSGYNNNNNNSNSMDLNATIIKNEKILEAELEEAIESASSGQVIVISPPADRINLTNQLSVVLIETPADSLQSVMKNTLSDKTIKESCPSLDQEIAQSQNRPRSDYENYLDSENSENLEDILAIAEYEPQRINAKRIQRESSQTPSEEANFEVGQTTRLPVVDYDVPKRRNLPRNFNRISDLYRPAALKSDLNVSSTDHQVPLTSVPSELDPVKIEEEKSKFERRQYSSPSSFYHKPIAVYTQSLRDRRHPKIELYSTTKSSLPGKLSYDSIPSRTNPLALPSSIDETSTLVPGLTGKIEEQFKNIQNLTNFFEPSKKSVHSSRVRTAQTLLPSPFNSILENQTSFGRDKSVDSILPTSGVSQANRRIDYYPTPQQAESSKHERQSLPNEQLGFLTRYNLPSLVTGKLAKSRSYPVASNYKQARSSEESREGKEKNDEEDSSETPNTRRLRTVIPARDSYDVSDRKNTSRPTVVHYREDRRAPNGKTTPIYDSYEKGEEEPASNNNRENAAYRFNRYQPIASATPVYDSYEKSSKSKLVKDSPLVSTTPVYDFYEDYKESANSKIVRNSPVGSYEDYKESAENSKTVRNSPEASYEDYKESENSKVVKNSRSPIISTTPVYDFYEDYKESEETKIVKNSPVVSSTPVYDSYEDSEESDKRKIVPQQQRLIPDNAEQRRRVPINSYPVSIQPSYNYNPARTIHPVTPINLLNNPIYQLHGLKSHSIPANGVYNPYTNYPANKSSRLASLEKQKAQVPRAIANNHRIISTTPTYDSHEDFARINNPPVAVPRIRNSNYVEHDLAKPVYNSKSKKIGSTSITSGEKNAEDVYHVRSRIPDAVIPGNTISPLPSQVPFQPQTNLHRASKVSSPAYVESIESNEYEDSIDRRPYGPDSKKLQTSRGPQYREINNRAIISTAAPAYDSYENDDREIIVSPSNRAKSIESDSVDYGNRIRTKVVEGQQDRVVAPSHTQVLSNKPSRQGSVKSSALNYEDSTLVRTHVDEVPVESVNRADVRDSSDYEDEVPAGSGHEEKQENYQTHEEAKDGGGGGEHKHEEGGGEKHEEDHHGSHGEKGDKGYKAWHEHDKGEKGHHDKEAHDKEYEEKKGDKKKHEDESDYHKEHHHEEKGDKEAEFGEKGEHQKGHSTKGQHVVHKKDEYEKKTEFYDESHEEDGEEKEGGYGEEHESEKGGHEKIGHHDSAHHEDKYGKKGEHEKGHHYHEHKGHKNIDGHDKHHHHEEKYGTKGGHEEGKKWSHKKGDNGKKDS